MCHAGLCRWEWRWPKPGMEGGTGWKRWFPRAGEVLLGHGARRHWRLCQERCTLSSLSHQSLPHHSTCVSFFPSWVVGITQYITAAPPLYNACSLHPSHPSRSLPQPFIYHNQCFRNHLLVGSHRRYPPKLLPIRSHRPDRPTRHLHPTLLQCPYPLRSCTLPPIPHPPSMHPLL